MATTTSTRPTVAPGSLLICGRCHAVRGTVRDRGGAQQLCACTPIEERRARRTWDGVDFNTHAELCRCCGLELLPSGSRWSVWFCETCKPLVIAFNKAVGYYVIPIGRHSIMNGVGARADELRSRAAIDRFVSATKSMFAAIGGLEAYAQKVVRKNVIALGFEPGVDVFVGEYLSRARRSKLTPQDAFAELVVVTFTSGEVGS